MLFALYSTYVTNFRLSLLHNMRRIRKISYHYNDYNNVTSLENTIETVDGFERIKLYITTEQQRLYFTKYDDKTYLKRKTKRKNMHE